MDRCAPSRVHQQELCAQEHHEGVCGSPGIATMLENLFSAHDRAAPYDERDTDIGRIFSSTVLSSSRCVVYAPLGSIVAFVASRVCI